MTNKAPIALMAVALFLAVQVQPRADEIVWRGKCPCDFTADIIPIEEWDGKVECKLGKFGVDGRTWLAAVPEAYGSPSLVAQLYLGGVCLRFDEDGNVVKEPYFRRDHYFACDREIIEYAQELKDQKGGRMVVDKGCNLM